MMRVISIHYIKICGRRLKQQWQERCQAFNNCNKGHPRELSTHTDGSWEVLNYAHEGEDTKDIHNIVVAKDIAMGKCASDDQQNDHFQIMHKRLPPELWDEIVKYVAFAFTKHESEGTAKYVSGHFKPKARSLWNLASVSRLHRRLVFGYWVYTIRLLEQNDSVKLEDLGERNDMNFFRCVKRLVCDDSFQVYEAPKGSFDNFKHLEELILDCHSDIDFGETMVHNQGAQDISQSTTTEDLHEQMNGVPQQQELPRPRMSYRRLRVKFPETLRILSVFNSHAPDIYFIQQVVDECPLLRSLTLARCTIFTNPQCRFWQNLPRTESDSYFSNQGVADYAYALGRELKKIKRLEEVKIGIYLTDHSAIAAHLEQHAGLSSSSHIGLDVWEQPCGECISQYHLATMDLEREAVDILAKEIPTLRSISWVSFCSEKRTKWSEHEITDNR